ncbi:hypothetical protein [Carboxylicivirga marina]|uniref:Uncharacterized protein n=1 Tax=Carboxylicivirga marina TaxID=2800988 RepID=A0ABS1HLF3_9BACT|nr:hypothetical protein [Carboxylicivirga marina]MBK3518507.1 hypothetical protein [Carboxylicivirga marina]
MNWGKLLKKRAALAFFCLVTLYPFTGLDAIGIDSEDVTVISEINCQNLKASQCKTVFEIKAQYSGVITIVGDYLSDNIGLVTVFTNDYKEIVTQNLHELNNNISFLSQKGKTYNIVWQLKGEVQEVKWSINEIEQPGISYINAIEVSAAKMQTSHVGSMDQWFVYEAEESGEIQIGSFGHTNENTCLFVYDGTGEVVIASSNYYNGTLQSQATLNVIKGERYFIKWSSAFSTGSYSWEIASL